MRFSVVPGAARTQTLSDMLVQDSFTLPPEDANYLSLSTNCTVVHMSYHNIIKLSLTKLESVQVAGVTQ